MKRLPCQIGALCVLLAVSQLLGQARLQAQEQPDREVSGFRIYIHHGSISAYDHLWDRLQEKIERIRAELGPSVLGSGEIHVVSSLNRWFRERGEAGQAPRWAQALTLMGRRTILLRMPDRDPLTTLTHELSHLGVADAVGGAHIPRWFLEGFARYQAEEWGLDWSITIARAALFGRTLAFEDLDTGFPVSDLVADLAYAQCFHLVRKLLGDYGIEAVQRWLGFVAEGTEWKAAFAQAYGRSVEQVFADWEESVKVWYAWVPAITSLTTTWAGLAILALWVGRRVRRRRRERLEAMARSEAELYRPDPDDDLFP